MPTVIIDPGHGGMDPGAVYQGRQEKDDNLRLALAVGELLAGQGVDVLYTRTDDVYDSPYRKAMIANESGADYLISFHRNASPNAGSASGIQTLVYADRGVAAQMARDINRELVALGFRDLGVIERPGLAVLRRSRMPAVLIETGFIDNEADNQKFDEEFEEIAVAIADGILETLRNEGQLPERPISSSMTSSSDFSSDDAIDTASNNAIDTTFDTSSDFQADASPSFQQATTVHFDPDASSSFQADTASTRSDFQMDQSSSFQTATNYPSENYPSNNLPDNSPSRQQNQQKQQRRPPLSDNTQPLKLYRVQVGAFRNRNYAYELNEQLTEEGFPAFILMDGDWYKVQVGAFSRLENAIRMEYRLRAAGYDTYITT
jgi:cell division septation protein DedD